VSEPNDSALDVLVEVAPDEIVHEGRRDLAAAVVFAIFLGLDRLVRVRTARRATPDPGRRHKRFGSTMRNRSGRD
jgi:hypothetical protein